MLDGIYALIRGDTYQRYWTLTDALGNPVDLTGAQAAFGISSLAGEVLVKCQMTDNPAYISIPAPTDGTIELAIPGSVTSTLQPTPAGPPQLISGLQIIWPDGTQETFDMSAITIERGALDA
ncbi:MULTISPECIES: hypothetical protein [unclassified Acidocella]|uniref:hypothetical protein n=1 Tax=unclassified Acidocella TaxID=2648610 RepID=UPI00028E9A93|nr:MULTISPECIES: hypothetical protein [unclassified Acidocella]EKN01121.1 hypothetical protein MXAZACID_02409 [Acidocella sp. MX-AZ02]WBO60546.1 hypothetical protein GT370_07185 [Acidocella sp. MX-AZ03]